MGATKLNHFNTNLNKDINNKKNILLHGPLIDEIGGVLRVYKDGYVERFPIVPRVGPSLAPEIGVACSDVLIDKFTTVWARFYVPKSSEISDLPLIVYFHGGGFCVGSASWSCYHDFLAKLSARSRCLIMSVNYRLAPENPLPAAYDDGVKAVMWLKQHANPNYKDRRRSCNLWVKQCNFSRIFLAGDSAGGNIAHRVSSMLDRGLLKPLIIEGTILIQPFFGGELRTESEKRVTAERRSSVLSLAASDAYWRLALPCGTNRDHPFCNPIFTAAAAAEKERMMVCVAEMDILRDREMRFCDDVEERSGGGKKKVKRVEYRGVGHAFQILDTSRVAQTRTHELMSHIQAFLHHLL